MDLECKKLYSLQISGPISQGWKLFGQQKVIVKGLPLGQGESSRYKLDPRKWQDKRNCIKLSEEILEFIL